jgi:hypothetical protein
MLKRVLIPTFIRKYVQIFRKEGFKGLIKKGGWRLLLGFILFYLIRDTILYVIPFLLIANGVHTCG